MKKITNLKDIKEAIKQSGITECEDMHCENCEFCIYPEEKKEFGNNNICVLLNAIYRAK